MSLDVYSDKQQHRAGMHIASGRRVREAAGAGSPKVVGHAAREDAAQVDSLHSEERALFQYFAIIIQTL